MYVFIRAGKHSCIKFVSLEIARRIKQLDFASAE